MERYSWSKSIVVNFVELLGSGLVFWLIFGAIFAIDFSASALSFVLLWPIGYTMYAAVHLFFIHVVFRNGIPIILLPLALALLAGWFLLSALKIAGRPLSWLLIKTFRKDFSSLITIEPFTNAWFVAIPETGDSDSWRWAG